MDVELLMLHMRDFFAVHNISTDPAERIAKVKEEITEWLEAVESGDKAKIMEETTDILITGFALFDSMGVHNPLWPMFLKLQQTAERPEYRRMREAK